MHTILGLLLTVATTSPIVIETPHKPLGGADCVPVEESAMHAIIVRYAREYGVSEGMMDYVVRHESGYDSCAVGDTHLTDPDGNPHLSLGAVQINRYWNPDVTESQALDADFSVRFLAENLSKGHCSRWTTCRAFQRSLSGN